MMPSSRLRLPAIGMSLLLALNGLQGGSVRAQARVAAEVPIVIPSGGDTSPCDSVGEVTHLDPHGDNFLSVQSGPGGKPFAEKDRLHSGAHVWVCGDKANWWAVVYGDHNEADCKIARPKQKQYAYTGPCRYGWVSKRYVEIIAG